MNDNNGYKAFRLKRNGALDISFEGSVVASVSSDPEEMGDRWTELTLYKTKGGNYVAQSVGRSILQGEIDIHTCEVYDTMEAAREFFKKNGRVTWLSQQLFDNICKENPEFVNVTVIE